MNLEVGQFARLKSGYICKIINVNDFREPNMKYGVDANYLKDVMFIGDDDIVKASYNIIDILEVGDYVNRDRVNGVVINEFSSYVILEGVGHYVEDLETVESKDIETILTHEQMEQMAYKVGE